MEQKLCYFYPEPEEGSVCWAGSEISSTFPCTEEYSRTCQWANEQRKLQEEIE